MTATGWRTLAIQSPVRISIQDEQVKLFDIKQQMDTVIPIDELNRVLLLSPSSVLTTGFLRELVSRKISIVICDKKHNPLGEVNGYATHEEAAGAILDQTAWSQERKDIIWADIAKCKIRNQIKLLELKNRAVPEPMFEYLKSIAPGDPTNREGQAARLYFKTLFGEDFRRHAPDAINAALNYGYSLICSGISRALALHGYHTALGIHHYSRNNKFNLSCDLMEPFRPFIDSIVAEKIPKVLDMALKKELIQSLGNICVYNGSRMTIDTAIEQFTLDTAKAMSDGRLKFREVEFE